MTVLNLSWTSQMKSAVFSVDNLPRDEEEFNALLLAAPIAVEYSLVCFDSVLLMLEL